MNEHPMNRQALAGKTIDSHSHLGVELKQYIRMEYPYAQTAEGLAYKQRSSGVDVNVVFPFAPDLYCDPAGLAEAERQPARQPLSPVPYAIENELLLREVYDYCPELAGRFLPFVCIDPARDADAQVTALTELAGRYPIYGVKVNPVACQSHAAALLDTGRPLLDLVAERNWPMVFHAATAPVDEYSQAADIFRIARAHPQIRICLAHALLMHRPSLQQAAEMDNVWVDTAAMKIQVDLINKLIDDGLVDPTELLQSDYDDYRQVTRDLVQHYPQMIIWGSDSPAYAFICIRRQGEDPGAEQTFRLKGTYEQEVAALRNLDQSLQRAVSNRNTLDYLFGHERA